MQSPTNDEHIRDPFPLKLYDMLEHSSECGLGHVVSWQVDGSSFRVHDDESFVQLVIRRFFRQSSLKSFERQLHIYGFRKIRSGKGKGGYQHSQFRRGHRGDVRLIIRRTKKDDEGRSLRRKALKQTTQLGEKEISVCGTSSGSQPMPEKMLRGLVDSNIDELGANGWPCQVSASLEALLAPGATLEDLLEPVQPESIFGFGV